MASLHKCTTHTGEDAAISISVSTELIVTSCSQYSVQNSITCILKCRASQLNFEAFMPLKIQYLTDTEGDKLTPALDAYTEWRHGVQWMAYELVLAATDIQITQIMKASSILGLVLTSYIQQQEGSVISASII